MKGNTIIHEQLQKAKTATITLLKKRSEELPPVIPDDNSSKLIRSGKPQLTLKAFGPNSPTRISFTVYENRSQIVQLDIRVNGSAIKDKNGKIYNGELGSSQALVLQKNKTLLPYSLNSFNI